MRKTLRFAIICCGVISDWHAQSIQELDGLELIGATDVYKPSLERFCQKFGVHGYDSPEDLFADPAVDVVCICTPSGMHAPLAVAASDAGKHVILEKPMALTHEQCDDIIAACARNGTKLEVISQYRCSPKTAYVKNAIDRGMFGKIVTGDIYMKYYRSEEYYASGGWRGTWKMDGGGALMNQGIHGVDVLQFLCGPVKSVFAHAKTLARDIEVEDTASAVLEFESGALGIIQGTTSVYPGYPRRMEICGTKGSVMMRDENIIDWQVEGQEPPADLPLGDDGHDTSSDPTALSLEGHRRQYQDLAEAIWYDRRPMVDEHAGRLPVDIILAIYESERTGKEIFLK